MIIFGKTLFIYFVILTAMRLMGKREIGELTPFDLVVSIMMAELGVIVIEKENFALWEGIIPIITLAGIEIIISYLSLKNSSIRKLINGSPTVLIKNGEIMTEAMRNSRYTIHDLLTQLRENGVFNVSEVEYAVLETTGELTVLPQAQNRGLTPQDLGLKTEYEGLPTVLIEDGEINYSGLRRVGLDQQGLKQQLTEKGVDSVSQVLVAALETDGTFYLSER